MSFLKVDSEVKKSKDAKNFPRKTRKGLPLPILKKDSHTRSCSLEVLPPVEQDLVCESFSSGFPCFQICLKRSSVEESFIQVRILALFPFVLTLFVCIINYWISILVSYVLTRLQIVRTLSLFESLLTFCPQRLNKWCF